MKKLSDRSSRNRDRHEENFPTDRLEREINMKKLSDRSSRKRKDRLEKGKIDIKKLSDRSSKKRKDRHNKNFTTDPLEKGKNGVPKCTTIGSTFFLGSWVRIRIRNVDPD